MSSSYRLVPVPVTVKTSPLERLPSPSESVSARVPFANVPRVPLARETFVNIAIPFSRSDACRVRFRASSGLQNEGFAVACHGFVPWVVKVSVGTRPIGSPEPTTQEMSPTLVLSWARLKVTEVRFDKPAARNISPESSRPFPFASVRESETPLLRLIGRLERVPFPDEPPACTKKRTSEIAGAGPNPGGTSIPQGNGVPNGAPGERRFTLG